MSEHTERKISCAQAINEALDQCLAADEKVILFGLGAADPKGIFGTVSGLSEKYGKRRVFDVPVSENALTGMAIGAASAGLRPILTHQRLDFTFLSMDQLINNAAKWHYMFAGKYRAPITVRMIIGRGWGQGPQHSQALHSLYAHVPGLKVVMPSSPANTKGLLISAIADDSPVIFIEHRWIHYLEDHVPTEAYTLPLGKAQVLREGRDITLVGISHMMHELRQTASCLSDLGISAELIDLHTLSPWDQDTVVASVKKTGRLLVADIGYESFGLGSEVVAVVSRRAFADLRDRPLQISAPDCPVPTSHGLSNYFYKRSPDILKAVVELFGQADSPDYKEVHKRLWESKTKTPHDVPDRSFCGPF